MRIRRPRAAIASAAAVAAVAAVVAIAGCSAIGASIPRLALDGGRIDTVGDVAFERELLIPPLADAGVDERGRRAFELTAAASETRFVDGPATPTLGYDGSHLGPTLVMNRGEDVAVTLHNDLDETTTLHWHGMHLPAAMDGGPHQPVAAGEAWSPAWTVDQQAATLWYHPHPHGATERQVRAGLAGLVIVRDGHEAALPLPRRYGIDDVPLIVQDVEFAADNALDDDNRGFAGALGDTILVNGTVGAYREVTTEAMRLRLLNASTARSYDFRFDDDRRFDQIASDGGLLAAPNRTDHVMLSPGERAEIVVRFAPGESTVLRSIAPDLGGRAARNGGADRFDVLEFRAASDLAPSPAVPAELTDVERLQETDASAERSFRFDGFAINGSPMELHRVDEVVELGATEVWTVRNGMDQPHNFHVHDVQFQVLSVAGSLPPPQLSGWKDTVYLAPQTDFRLIMRFEDYADPTTPYMYHCHLLWHEDAGMMGQFVVVEPGTAVEEIAPRTIEGDSHDHH